ncbi:hypothetical protein B0H66DRAFT_278570 [Apodospora peruviana]|uniref:Uncharacterized protein n=1 Tax=Apodospora peruviana TaxID=516989 RepID=A0AAE0M281_9PEZI|nr:hypothetical protein B0H66DRAFT_278570 [Apodospora peruviana]
MAVLRHAMDGNEEIYISDCNRARLVMDGPKTISRIPLTHGSGNLEINDRFNITHGEIYIRLSGWTEIHIYRNLQEMTVLASPESAPTFRSRESLDEVSLILQTIARKPTRRRLEFDTLQDAHKFQEALTGFRVIFDSRAMEFTCSNPARKMGISMHKTSKLGSTRVQVIQRDEMKVQILSLSHSKWSALNFKFDGTAVLFKTKHIGKYYLKLLD